MNTGQKLAQTTQRLAIGRVRSLAQARPVRRIIRRCIFEFTRAKPRLVRASELSLKNCKRSSAANTIVFKLQIHLSTSTRAPFIQLLPSSRFK